ncbi:MAG: prepilin-type N-terminal cleavage/methylation domain-containing protein [Candidatus Eremiobacteraeota bacterium]|nr:prepilin-type N-terminal cleavage/methylation domain-containing protein [Candidatus Eremiobacteraeota bacterium]
MVRFSGRKWPSGKQRGFSLIELLIALTIFAVSLLAIYGTFPVAMQAITKAEKNFLANQVATQEIEFLKTLQWDELSMDNDEINERPPTVVTSTINGVTHNTTFNSIIRIDPLTEDPDNIKVVRVQVSWVIGSSRGDKFYYVQLETMLNNPEQ